MKNIMYKASLRECLGPKQAQLITMHTKDFQAMVV